MPKIETQVVHAGQEPDPATGAVMTPIYQTSTFRQSRVGKHSGYEYSRTGNPTRAALEACIAVLEGGTHGFAMASGMAAIDSIVHLLGPADHILAVDDLYGGTHRLFEKVYARLGVESTYASPSDPQRFVEKMRPETRLIWLESPTNPLLKLCDIEAIVSLAKARDPSVLVGVDNTFATPYLQRPLELGADIVQHSTTKYLGGHSDTVGGAIVTNNAEAAEQLAFLQNTVGAVPGPFDCFMVLRGIKTLAVRMDRHSASAQSIAEYLQDHAEVAEVHYPGLPDHPHSELAQHQMRAPGGIVSFTAKGGPAGATQVVETTRIFTLAESLGGVESLIEIPAKMTHASVAESELAVDPALIRLSVGLEAVEDLISDLDRALQLAAG